MLTEAGDTIFDPFAGSCVTGEVAETLQRNWTCCETVEEYIDGAKGRFVEAPTPPNGNGKKDPGFYKIYSSSKLWNTNSEHMEPFPKDGGRKRPIKKRKENA